MNHLFKISLSLIIIGLALFSCSKDGKNPAAGSIKMDDQSFPILFASIAGVSIGEDGHSAISFSSISGTTTYALTIDVESFTKESIEGNYAFPENANDKLLDDWLTNYSVMDANGDETTSSNLETGTVSIIHNDGDNYTVEMDLLMVDGITFKGKYTGDFTVMFSNN